MTEQKQPVVLLIDEATPPPGHTDRAVLARTLDKLRKICRTDTEGGVADYVRLDANEPADEHGNFVLPPVLAVTVTEVLAVVDEAQAHLDRAGDAGTLREMLDRIVRMGRATNVRVQPDWPTWQYPTLEALNEAIRTGEAFGHRPPAVQQGIVAAPLWRNTRPTRPLLDAGRDGPVEAMVWSQISKTGSFPDGRLPSEIRTAINDAPVFRFAGADKIRPAEVHAALGTLTAHGRCEFNGEPGRMFRYRATCRPAYAEQAQGAVALAVVILGLLDTRDAGLVMADIVTLVKDRYQMRPGVEVSWADVGNAIAFLAARGVVDSRLGRYVSTSRVPSGGDR